MDTEKRTAKRLDFLRKSIYISYGNINEAMNTLSCESLYEAIRHRDNPCDYYKKMSHYKEAEDISFLFFSFWYSIRSDKVEEI